MQQYIGLILVIFMMIFVSCLAADNPDLSAKSCTQTASPREWEFSFADGSNNFYSLQYLASDSAYLLEYKPIKAHESSSGVYSGGQTVKVELSSQSAEQIHRWVTRLASKTELHVKNRMMMTGKFLLKEVAEEKCFILSSSDELREFTGFMRSLVEK